MPVIEFPRRGLLLAAVAVLGLSGTLAAAEPALTLVVMDPLAAPLSCPCVKGYAQRDYTKLAAHLEKALGRPVTALFSESLAKAVGTADDGKNARADIVIGKRSVVATEGKNTRRLPAAKQVRWKQVLFNEGLGGVAVAGDRVVVGDRDSTDREDVFHGLDRTTGARVWTLSQPAEGKLDYGNSPRATPLLHDGRAYLLGAFGHLHCVRLADGAVEWKRHLRNDFQADAELVWGACSSPLIVDGRLIVNPGAREASLVALDPATGAELWRSPGPPPAFASFVVGDVAGRRQLVGFDKTSLGGWDPTTGERLWSLEPRVAGDFNVPTPILLGGRVFAVTENNGARTIGVKDGNPQVLDSFPPLVPDMHTPVATAGRIFAVHRGKAFCLGTADLSLQWTHADRSLKGHASIVASDERVLVFTAAGEIVLLDAHAERFEAIARQRLFERDVSLYAHPALADTAIYVRGPRNILCVSLREAVSSRPGG